MNEVKVPSLGVNDKGATIVEIVVGEGEAVDAGDVLAVLETTKTTFDIEAAEAGYVTFLFKDGDEVEVGQTICLIVSERIELDVARESYFEGRRGTEEDPVRITRKAEIKAKERGVDLRELAKSFTGIIREKDVEEFLKQSKQHKQVIEETPIGQLDQSFISSILNDYATFAAHSSEEKIKHYRENGAVIGDRVKISKGSVIVSDYLQLMDDSSIGEECYIRTRSFSLGRMSVIGNKANIVANTVKIGEVSTFGFNVIVSGGFAPNAVLRIGDGSLISANCLLDAGDGITIGNEVGISPFVKLYTHNHWQSELEGYHSNFGPVVIEDNAYVTGDSLIVPGVTIGQGATVLANSTVIDNVEARTQVCGNPARVIGRVTGELSIDKRERIALRLLKEMKRAFAEHGRVDPESVVYMPRYVPGSKQRGKVVLTFFTPNSIDEASLDCILFDLQKLQTFGAQNEISDEVRNFLRRRGVRFKPIYWRYINERHLYND
jgi:acetyltransferase-like isoleucine patch superfamily enzyme